jgi:hypothetical protein
MRVVSLCVVLLLVAGACSTASGDVEPPAATSTTAAATTTPTTASSTTAASADLSADALAAFEEWVGALHAGDYEGAWGLMAPSSQAALGSYELFESWGSEMTEGWGAWAEATEVSVSVDEDVAGRSFAVVSGVVAKEGMPERDTTKVFFTLVDGGVVLSPFEEFGNVATGLANPDRSVPVPSGSGSGRRIVYSNGAQRVWVIDGDETVVDTYLVSGREGVPDPGAYEVFSKSEIAYAGHDGITMRYMVRFTYADSGLAIGFHSIPNTASGEPLQTEEQLGEFHSAGCVRQSLGQAAALYDWADEGTAVYVIE